MSWRSELEDKHTVTCEACGTEHIDINKKPGQKYLIETPCVQCSHVRKKRR